jgi:predicted DNA-binding transcriptional regulator AlpA
MTSHEFTLIVEGPDLQERSTLDVLFEAGCDDAVVGRLGAIQYLDFDREAETFADAVLTAAEAVEAAVPEARVVHLAPDELVTMAEIAARTGRTRESVRMLISGDRGAGDFPTPATHFKRRQRMWRWQEVAAWFAQRSDDIELVGDVATAEFITAFNAGLQWRAAHQRISVEQWRRIRKLVGQGDGAV